MDNKLIKRLVRSIGFLTSFIIVLLIPISNFYIKYGLVYLSLCFFLFNAIPLCKNLTRIKVKKAIKHYLLGITIGFSLIVLIILSLVIFKEIKIIKNKNFNLLLIAAISIFWIIQSFFEEYLIRGILFEYCTRLLGSNIAVIFTSFVFALMHIGNLNITFLSFLNIFTFALFCGILVKEYKSIFLVSGVHFIWNYLQGNIFGIEVSGNVIQESIFNCFHLNNSPLLHGGVFGLEGGLMTFIYLFISLVIVILISIRKNNKIMNTYYLYKSIDNKFLLANEKIDFIIIDQDKYLIKDLLASELVNRDSFKDLESILNNLNSICINLSEIELSIFDKDELIDYLLKYELKYKFVKGNFIIRDILNYEVNK